MGEVGWHNMGGEQPARRAPHPEPAFGSAGRRATGPQGCRPAGEQARRGAGPQGSRGAGEQGRRAAGAPGRRAQGHRGTGPQGRRAAGRRAAGPRGAGCRAAGRRGAGAQGRRGAGAPGRRGTGAPGSRAAGEQGSRAAGPQAAGAQGRRGAGARPLQAAARRRPGRGGRELAVGGGGCAGTFSARVCRPAWHSQRLSVVTRPSAAVSCPPGRAQPSSRPGTRPRFPPWPAVTLPCATPPLTAKSAAQPPRRERPDKASLEEASLRTEEPGLSPREPAAFRAKHTFCAKLSPAPLADPDSLIPSALRCCS